MSHSGRRRGDARWPALLVLCVAPLSTCLIPARSSAAPELGQLSHPTSQVVISGSPVAGAAAAADVGQGMLELHITKLTPLDPGPNSTLRLSGIVTNISDHAVAGPAVALRVSPTPVASRSEISAVVSGHSSREGARVPGATQELGGPLSPGQSVNFSLSAKIATLRLPRAGAYVVGAEALGDGGIGLRRQDLERTFLGWWPPDTPAARLGVNLIWPISSLPDRDGAGTFLSDSLGLAVSSTGRLANLVKAGSERTGQFTWLLDPEVLQATDVMSDGYRYYQKVDDETPVDGDRGREASQWLTQLRSALNAKRTHAISGLYGTPDVDAAVAGKAMGTVLAQRPVVNEQTADVLTRKAPTTVAYLPGGNAASTTLDALRAGGVRSVIMSDSALPTRAALNYTPTGTAELTTKSGVVRVLLLDSALTDTLAMPAATSADVVAMRQRLVAETLVTALERPNLSRVVAASPSQDWDPSLAGARAVLRVIATTAWVAPVSSQAALKSSRPALSRTHMDPTDAQVMAQLPTSYVDTVRANQRGVASYSRLLSNPDDIDSTLLQAPTRQLSSWFRTNPDARAALAAKVTGQVSAAVDSVDVVSTGSITISGQSGTIPVTVSNNGRQRVRVGLVLTSEPAILFQADPIAPFEIAPQRRTSVEVPAKLAGTGNVQVRIQVVNGKGESVGTPTTLLVRSAAYARAARVIVQLSLVLLVLAVAVHGVRRARRMAAAARRAK